MTPPDGVYPYLMMGKLLLCECHILGMIMEIFIVMPYF